MSSVSARSSRPTSAPAPLDPSTTSRPPRIEGESTAVTPLQTDSRPVPAVRTACLLIADDLTGACDSAVHFAAAGFPTFVPLAPEHAPGAASVLAFSSESRDIKPAAVPFRLVRFAPAVRFLAPRTLFKQIDSTLRVNTA